MRNVRIQPWLSIKPLKFHLDVHLEDFYFGNPPKIQCRHPNLAQFKRGALLLSFELLPIWKLITGAEGAGPFVLNLDSLDVTGLLVNIMNGETGQLNLPQLGKALTENELKADLGGKVIHARKDITLPNLLRVKIFAARKLINFPDINPFVEVSIRRTTLKTLPGQKAEMADGTTEFSFDQELILPVPEVDALVVVKVFSTGKKHKRQLLGQWFMTIKYLIQEPTYNKHSSCKVVGPYSIVGTFLLTDAKLRGSACRHLGFSELGRGFSGELDMAIQFTHANIAPPPPPPMDGLQQIGANGFEDDLKMGNKEELREFFKIVPVRLNVTRIAAYDLEVAMSDMFSGLKLEGEEAEADKPSDNLKIEHIKFGPYKEVTVFGFFESFTQQAIAVVVAKPGAIFSATDKIVNGLIKNMVSTFKRVFLGAKVAMPKVNGEALDPTKFIGDGVGAGVQFLDGSTSGLRDVGGKALGGVTNVVGDTVGGTVGAVLPKEVNKAFGDATGALGQGLGGAVDQVLKSPLAAQEGLGMLGKSLENGSILDDTVENVGKLSTASLDFAGMMTQKSLEFVGNGLSPIKGIIPPGTQLEAK